MGLMIPITTLVECVTEDGETVLSGRFGKAEIVGRCRGTTDDGRRIWSVAVTESDKSFKARKAYQRRKRGDDDG